MRCPYCERLFTTENPQKRYCSAKCQKYAHQKRWYLSFKNGGFEWLNQKWMPTKIQDRVWAVTGFESVETYLERRKWADYTYIAIELGITYNFAKELYRKYTIQRM